MDFDTDRFRKFYDEQFEKGKKVAEDLKDEAEKKKSEKQSGNEAQEKETTVEKKEEKPINEVKTESPKNDNDDIVNKLKELAQLKEMGVINEEEFSQMKTRLIENFGK